MFLLLLKAVKFDVKYESIDELEKCKVYTTLPSTTSITELKKKLAELLGLAENRVLLGWRLSTEAQKTPLSKLETTAHLVTLIEKLRPLCVPAIMKTGEPSKRRLKEVWVVIVNRMGNGGASAGASEATDSGKGKVSCVSVYKTDDEWLIEVSLFTLGKEGDPKTSGEK